MDWSADWVRQVAARPAHPAILDRSSDEHLGEQPPLEAADLKQVLAERADLDVVVVGLADTTKEVDRIGEAQVPVERL